MQLKDSSLADSRLIMKESCKARFEPAVKAVDHLIKASSKSVLLIAIDGKCASGKTTLGYYLKSLYDCNLFHMDDFFLQPNQRTEERLQETGGNVDYERFQEEVLKVLLRGEQVRYRPYSCKEQSMQKEISIPGRRLNIIEGSYSLHPYFKDPYDLHIFMDISKEKQIENIRNRNGEKRLIRFIEEWIPKEEAYFTKFAIEKECLKLEWKDI